MTAEEFAMYIDEPGVIVVDVRTAAEYVGGHIPGALLIDLYSLDFEERMSALPIESPIAVYCQGGVRSSAAMTYLLSEGYSAEELSGGITTWRGPVERGM